MQGSVSVHVADCACVWSTCSCSFLSVNCLLLCFARRSLCSFVAKVRPRTATSQPCSDARTRPASAPSEVVKRRSRSASSTNRPLVLVPSLANVPNTAASEISRAELEAWATLSQIKRRPHESRPTVTFDRACPNSAVGHHSRHYSREGSTPGRGRTTMTTAPRGVDMHRCNLEQFGSGQNSAAVAMATPSAKADTAAWSKQQYHRAARAMLLPSAGKNSAGFQKTAGGAHTRGGSYHDGPGYDGCGGGRQTLVRDHHLDDCNNVGRAEHDAGHQREHQQDRSDISVRCVVLHSCMRKHSSTG